MSESEFRHIGKLAFVVNGRKPEAGAIARRLESIAQEEGMEVSSTNAFPIPPGFLKGKDACCVIGGDGTFLSAAEQSTRYQVPLIGVNRGTLGFLTTYTAEEIESLFPEILKGQCVLEKRTLLECEIDKSGIEYALNDIVVKSASTSHIVHVNVFADDEYVTTYICDGLIFSSPTGSTAYNLSAGGPMIHPHTEAIALTPICPHTLSNRAIIFPANVDLRVENADSEDTLLAAVDGRNNLNSLNDRPITIRTSAKKLPMYQKLNYSHFEVVRHKLKWNGGYAGQLEK